MMVRLIIEYASTVWAPLNLTYVNQLESIQKRVARLCYTDFSLSSSITKMISSLNLPTLEQRRSKAMLITQCN